MVLDYTESSVKLLEASVVTALCKITVVCLLSIRRTMAESSFTNRLFFPQLPEIPIHRIFVYLHVCGMAVVGLDQASFRFWESLSFVIGVNDGLQKEMFREQCKKSSV